MKHLECILASLALAVCVGCRTTEEVLHDYEANATVGNYAALPGEVAELADRNDDSRLLWNLMAGSGYYLMADGANALARFDRAEDAFQKNDRESVFATGGQGALAMMTNDRSFPYDGGGLDRVFTCLYKAIDYMCAGDAAAARTELNRSAQHQENWLWERRKDLDAAQRKMEADARAYAGSQQEKPVGNWAEQAGGVLADASFAAQVREKCAFDPAVSGDLSRLSAADYMNAYAEHVCGVFRWLNGDDARGYLKDVAGLVPGNPTSARDFADVERGVKPVDQVWVWAEDGLCPCREEWRLDLPLAFMPYAGRYVLYAGMALPYLRERTWAAVNWSVQAGNVATPMAELSSVDRLVKTEYDVYMRGALAREVTRTVVKVGAQIALGCAADNTGDSNHAAWLRFAQMGVATWAASTTAADLRSWTALPKTVKTVRIDRPADGRILVVADGQAVPLQVPPGNSMVFVRKPGPQAAPVVKIATFR